MKSIFLTFITLLAIQNVHAVELADYYADQTYSAELNVMMGEDYLYGDVRFHTFTNEVVVELQEPGFCPEGEICPLEALPDPLVFTFTDLDIKRNWCGAVEIKSDTSNAVVIGGGTARINLIDTQDSMCDMFMPGTMLNFMIDGYNPGGFFTTSYNGFVGDYLVPMN